MLAILVNFYGLLITSSVMIFEKYVAGGIAQEVECLPGMCKVLSSISSTAKEKYTSRAKIY
jgi:hypothetical protein